MCGHEGRLEFGNEYVCTYFFDVDTNASGVDISRDGEHIGSIIGLDRPGIDDEEENIEFDNQVIEWIVENE